MIFREFIEKNGSPYVIMGTIVHGKGAGRKVGMPTANLQTEVNVQLPPFGVYGTKVKIDGNTYLGVTNVGLRPSDDENPTPTVETFIIDFDEDIYDKRIRLEFVLYIRPIRKFEGGLCEVKKQVEKDINAFLKYMNSSQ